MPHADLSLDRMESKEVSSTSFGCLPLSVLENPILLVLVKRAIIMY